MVLWEREQKEVKRSIVCVYVLACVCIACTWGIFLKGQWKMELCVLQESEREKERGGGTEWELHLRNLPVHTILEPDKFQNLVYMNQTRESSLLIVQFYPDFSTWEHRKLMIYFQYKHQQAQDSVWASSSLKIQRQEKKIQHKKAGRKAFTLH